MKYLLILIIGLTLGMVLAEYTTVYRMSCDTTKYGWMWTNQKRFSSEGFTCLNNENQQIRRETHPYIIYQMIKLEIGIYD